MEERAGRLGFLVSTLVHLLVVVVLLNRMSSEPSPSPSPAVPPEAPRAAVFLPPAEVLRQLRPAPPVRPTAALAPAPAPGPVPTPVPEQKDRISVGPPSAERAQGPLILRREDDLTATPRGTPRGDGTPRTGAPAPSPAPTPPAVADGATAGGRLRLPPGLLGREPATEDAPAGPPRRSSLGETLRNLDQRLAESGPRGTVSGTGQQMGPLFFDPEGADFTVWINHFKNEVYRNWIVPQAVLLGMRGHVDLEFTVERDGRVSDVRLLKSAGNAALDRAAANALVASRLMPLPSDFSKPRLTIQVAFFYNAGPQG